MEKPHFFPIFFSRIINGSLRNGGIK